jgi:NAD(P)-dependent dehydrogenase (short-subunit alcohol dehydrogenase family)
MERKTALITGATAGIGKVTAKKLAFKNYKIVIVGRNQEKTEECVAEIKRATSNPHIEYLLGDLSVMNDARRIGNEFNAKYEDLHLLINNAGGVYQTREETAEGFEKTMATNHLSHFIMTNILLEKIKKSAPGRIVNVSSMSHYQGRWNPDDINMQKKYFVMWAYSNSKLYNVLFTKYLAEQLKDSKVTVNCLHPGVVKTKIGSKNTKWWGAAAWNLLTALKGISEDEGAKTSLYLASSPEVEGITGKYFDKCKEKEPSEIAKDPKAAEELWKMSLEMSGL